MPAPSRSRKLHPVTSLITSTPPKGWEATLAAGVAKAEAALPKGIAGRALSGTTLDKAKALLDRIRTALVGKGQPAPASATALRRSARILAGAAARAATQATDELGDRAERKAIEVLRGLSTDAWKLAIPPMLIVAGLALLVAKNEGIDLSTLAVLGLLGLALQKKEEI